MKLEEIIEEAGKLPEDQRASIASQLIHSLESPHHSVSDEEVNKRMKEAEEDPSVFISHEELLKGIGRS